MELVKRILGFALLSATLCAGGPGDWIPARWQGGPLELLLREKAGRPKPEDELARAIRDWYGPSTLELLRNTPVNCLLATWSAGAGEAVEASQQQLVGAYAREAHARGLAVAGLVYPGADPAQTARSATQAGLDGLALDGDFSKAPGFAGRLRDALRALGSSLPVIPLGARDALTSADWPVLGTGDGVTPQVRVFSESGGVAATPTSEPWIESNLWLVRLLRMHAGARPVWLAHRLEKPGAEDYARAIGEAAAAGGRWVVAPDEKLRAGLFRRDAGALAVWKRITECLQFHIEHADWKSLAPAAALGIVYDARGKYTEISDENLNLITRRRVPYRIIERAALSAEAVGGLPAVLATDLAPPEARERELLAAYIRKGGMLVAGPAWSDGAVQKDYAVIQQGTGRIVAYKQDPPEPESLAKDLLDLIDEGDMPVRLFHVTSVLGQVSAAPGGARLLVQLINYATTPSDQITVRVTGEFRSARLFSPGEPASELKMTASGGRVDVRVPKIGVYGAIVLER